MITQLKSLQARREREGEEGFTLIELLIVIVVLGILAAVVVFALGSVTGNAKASACNADAKTIETAVASYNADPPSTCSGVTCTIQLETYSATVVSGDVTPGNDATYSTGTQAQELISNGDLNSWPQTSNGYSMSLATNGSYYLAGTSTTVGTAKAGEVILYIPADAASGAGQIYDDETSATGCNAL